jgi:autotransporter translocation and assembly factor TamB
VAALAALALVVVGTVVGLKILHSPPVRYAVAQWLEDAADAVGVALDIETLRWGAVPPSVTLGGVRTRSGGLQIEADTVHLSLAGLSLARGTVELGDVVAHGVRARWRGELPRPAADGRRIRIRVRNLDLREVLFDGETRQGAARLRLVDVDAGWVTEDGVARGFVLAPRILVEARRLEPVEGSLRARLQVDDAVRVPLLELQAEGLRLAGDGAVGDGLARFDLVGTLDLAELDRVVHASDTLAGTVSVAATLDTSADRPLTIQVQGDDVRAARFPLREVRGSLAVDGTGVIGTLERATLLGGTVSGRYRLRRDGDRPAHRVEIDGLGVDAPSMLDVIRVPSGGLTARADLDVELEWTGRRLAEGRGMGTARFRPRPGALPTAGELRVSLTPDGLLHFEAEDLVVGGSVIDWQGPLTFGDWQPAWSLRAEPAVLDELVPMVNRFAGRRILPDVVDGSGLLVVGLSGPWSQLVVTTRADVGPVSLSTVTFDRLVGDASVAGGQLTLDDVRYRVGDGDGEVDGTVVWDATGGGDRIDLEMHGSQLPLERVASWAGVNDGVSGTASFAGGLRGEPADPRGSWALGLSDVALAGQPLGSASASVELADGTFAARGLQFDRGLAGDLAWNVADARVSGHLSWARMALDPLGPTLAPMLGDYADVDVEVGWNLEDLPTGTAEIAAPGGRLTLRAEPERILIDGEVAGTGHGRLVLERGAPTQLSGSGEILLDDARELAARIAPDADVPLEGQGLLEVDVEWRVGDLPEVSGRLTDLELELDGRSIRLERPAPFRVDRTGVQLDGLLVTLAGDEVFLRGRVAADGSLQGNLSGTFDALLLRFLLPEWEPSGRVTGVVEILGSVEAPRLEGIVEIADGSFRLPATRTVISRVGGTVLLSSDEAVLDGVRFRFMRGDGRATGRIGVRDGVPVLALAGTVEGLDYPLFDGLVPRLRGSWQLDGPADDLLLSGDLEVVRAALRRNDELAVVLVDWFMEDDAPPTGEGVRLDLRVEADRTLDADNPFMNLDGSASLHVTGTTARPGLVGSVEIEEGGELTFQGVRYTVERATVTFTDPLEIDPIIDFQARAWVQNYQVGIQLSGTADRLVPTVTSDPPLPESEVYALLGMGLRGDAVGQGSVGVGLASTLISRELGAELTRRTQMVLPVDQVRVDPFAETSTGNPTARVTVVKQLNPRWTVIVQSNLSSNREEVVVSRWYLGPGLFVEAMRDIDGSYALDVKLRRRY